VADAAGAEHEAYPVAEVVVPAQLKHPAPPEANKNGT